MTLTLAGVEAKIKRAADHINTIKGEASDWRDTNPYRFSKHANADLTQHSLILRITNLPDLERWALIAGDAIHNLRSSLDHVVYAIAVHESGQNPPPDESKLAFPVCDDCPEFTQFERRKLGTLSLDVRTAIESVQPYHRKNQYLPPLLTVLHDFDITDKHKLLRLGFTAIARFNIGLTWDGNSELTHMEIEAGELRHGAEIAAFTFDRPTHNVQNDRSVIKAVIALWHGMRDATSPVGSDRTDLISILNMLAAEVREAIDIVVAAVKV